MGESAGPVCRIPAEEKGLRVAREREVKVAPELVVWLKAIKGTEDDFNIGDDSTVIKHELLKSSFIAMWTVEGVPVNVMPEVRARECDITPVAADQGEADEGIDGRDSEVEDRGEEFGRERIDGGLHLFGDSPRRR